MWTDRQGWTVKLIGNREGDNRIERETCMEKNRQTDRKTIRHRYQIEQIDGWMDQ